MTDRRQRQKQAAAAAREARRKAAVRRELRRRILVGLGLGTAVAVALLLAGTFSGEETLPDEVAAFRDQPTACDGAVPDPAREMRFDRPINQALRPDATLTATLVTSCGTIVIDLDTAGYPQTVNNFVFLARNGYYDGTVFHRIAPGFVAQGGDPTARGDGDPGYSIGDEFPPAGFVYEEGVVAMANAGRGTTGGQFFIVTGPDAATLGPSFNVLGRVKAGLDVLERIDSVPTRLQPSGRERSYPTETVYLESVTIAVEG